jgi:hypothetical protein
MSPHVQDSLESAVPILKHCIVVVSGVFRTVCYSAAHSLIFKFKCYTAHITARDKKLHAMKLT